MFSRVISNIKLLFSKDKELYVFIRRITGITPGDIELYRLSLVHRSNPVKMSDGRWANNERLEFLGDAVLDTVVADYLYRKYPGKHEGFLTSTRAKIVQRESLNQIGRSWKLDSHVRALSHSSSHNSYINGNALEALVGAIYLDKGYAVAQKFIEKKIIGAIDLKDLVKTERNFKSRLIEWTQKYRVDIEFELVETTADQDNNPIFKTAVMLGGIYVSDAKGYSKKESHQEASRLALDRLHTDNTLRQQILSTAHAEGELKPSI